MNAQDWIEKLPELDRLTLTDLVQGNFMQLAKPRTMVFVLYDINNEQLGLVTKTLEHSGWHVNSRADPEQPALFMVEAKKTGYIINEESYLHDTKFFVDTAERYNIHYDGWYAS